MRTAIATSFLLLTSTVATSRPRVAQEETEEKEEKEESDGPEGEAVLPIKLDDLIEATVQRNPDLIRAKIDRVAAINAAGGERKSQAWTATAGADYKRFALAEAVPVEFFTEVANETVKGSVGIGRNLPTGGNFSVGFEVVRENKEYLVPLGLQKDDGTPNTGMQPVDGNGNPYDFILATKSALRGTLKQPLARGFGPAVALAGIHKADIAATQATLQAQLTAETQVRDSVKAYWDLALSAYEVDVRAQALEYAKKQEELTHEQMRGGMVAQTALNAVLYGIQMRQQALLKAQLEFEAKSLEMRRKAGLRLDRRTVVLTPGEPFVIGDDEFEIDDMLVRSRAANRRLADNQLQKKAADIDVAVAQNGIKPQLDFTVSGAVMGSGPPGQEGVSGAIGTIGASYEVSVGLSLQWELTAANKRIRDAAVAKRKRLDVDREALEREIDSAVVNAVKMANSARAQVILTEKAIEVAEENVRAERAQFMLNKTSNFSVMGRQQELIDARLQRGYAVAEYHKAVADLQFLSGIILQQYRVNVRTKADALARASR